MTDSIRVDAQSQTVVIIGIVKALKFIPALLLVISSLLLLNFLWWHWQLGMMRYFDVDEFAHLKWAYELFSGKRPYADFLSFFPPGYHWFLAPLFFFGKGITPMLLGRLGEWGIFAGLVGSTIALFWMVRKSLWAAMLAGAFLSFLPLPFDKFLEIRPDTLATFLVLIGVIGEIGGIRGRKKGWIIAGVAYALSLLVLPKMLPNVLVGIGVAIFAKKENISSFFLSFFIPFMLFGLWMLALGHLDVVIYSLTKLPLESNKISQIFIMMPDLFFYPNSIFYGNLGWNPGLITNHILWVIGGLIGIYRLVTARTLEEFLISGNFVAQLVFYVAIVPLKHSQYLIPVAVFIAWYLADGMYLLYKKIPETIFIIFLAGSFYLFQMNQYIETPKLGWTNREDLDNLKKLYATVPTSEYILDLDGRTLYYKDPYYACCIPFGQFAPYLSRPLPTLSQALEQTKTNYIFEGALKRVDTLTPEDQVYVRAHYTASQIPGLLLRK